jgi:uncharacterized protein (TIGR03067 family)
MNEQEPRMMKTLCVSVLSLTLAILAGDVEAADQVPSGDLGKLQGLWTTLAGPHKDIPVAIEIRGKTVTVRVTITRKRSIQAKGELILNEKVAPKALDWVKFTGLDDQEFPEILAIYELSGDELKICNGGPNNQRPTEFKPGDGCLADVLTFKRIKRDVPDQPVASAPSSQ